MTDMYRLMILSPAFAYLSGVENSAASADQIVRDFALQNITALPSTTPRYSVRRMGFRAVVLICSMSSRSTPDSTNK